MLLGLMRHAEAGPVDGDIERDADRILTAYGRLQAKTIADELKRQKIRPQVVCSPLVRAVQTAEIVCQTFALIPTVKDVRLKPRGVAPNLRSILSTFPDVQALLLIGHQPDIGMLVAQVVGFELGFSPAALAVFESQSPQEDWHFLWTRRPEDLFKST
jgi:phosphohistidine phosphatase